MSLSDFDLGTPLGEGSFGNVVRAVRRNNGQECAVKVLEKRLLLRQRKQNAVMQEKQLLSELDHVGIVKLIATFQDERNLYMAVELASGPELYTLLQSCGRLNESVASFYLGEVCS